MIVPKGSRDLSRDLYGEHNATAVLAVLCLAAFMAFTAMLLILAMIARRTLLRCRNCTVIDHLALNCAALPARKSRLLQRSG
jgi:hypothetical protein